MTAAVVFLRLNGFHPVADSAEGERLVLDGRGQQKLIANKPLAGSEN